MFFENVEIESHTCDFRSFILSATSKNAISIRVAVQVYANTENTKELQIVVYRSMPNEQSEVWYLNAPCKIEPKKKIL